jgi:hypothetical protein
MDEERERDEEKLRRSQRQLAVLISSVMDVSLRLTPNSASCFSTQGLNNCFAAALKKQWVRCASGRT